MVKNVSNMDELAAAILPVMKEMVDKLAGEVYKTLNYFLHEYYSSYTPKSYRRTERFLRSAVKVDAKIVRGKAVAFVYIDTDYMNDYYNATGEQVASWANQGLHGGLDTGDNTPHVWDDTIDETVSKGKLLRDAVAYLKSKGFSVTV